MWLRLKEKALNRMALTATYWLTATHCQADRPKNTENPQTNDSSGGLGSELKGPACPRPWERLHQNKGRKSTRQDQEGAAHTPRNMASEARPRQGPTSCLSQPPSSVPTHRSSRGHRWDTVLQGTQVGHSSA